MSGRDLFPPVSGRAKTVRRGESLGLLARPWTQARNFPWPKLDFFSNFISRE